MVSQAASAGVAQHTIGPGLHRARLTTLALCSRHPKISDDGNMGRRLKLELRRDPLRRSGAV
jgi:hypothetical protein